jgi:hypothetical protein
MQSFGFCSSLNIGFEQNFNDVAPYLLSISVCLFVISGRTELFLEDCVWKIKCRVAQIPNDCSSGPINIAR